MPYKRLWEIGSFKVEPPNERSLQILFSPQVDEGAPDATVLMSTIAPHTGTTGAHTHDVDEFIYVITGRGVGLDGAKTYDLVPGTVIYAPAGVEHECRNLGDDTMQMFCVFMPSLPDESVEKMTKNAELRVSKE
jgi:quercetin dioxygenase-like cupin family protein